MIRSDILQSGAELMNGYHRKYKDHETEFPIIFGIKPL
jgi:hypothetical protein